MIPSPKGTSAWGSLLLFLSGKSRNQTHSREAENTLGRLKKILQDSLPLSFKLFLRRLLRVLHLGQPLPKQYSLATPELAAADFDLRASLAEKKPEKINGPTTVQSSIIIPVFNKAEFTFQCLTSLMKEIDFSQNEVIIVDNASTDDTKRVPAHFEDLIRVISNDANRGFVDASNQGAALARGKYLVFLNNDTKVLSGWLDNLVDTIEADPATGAVGSMFLYPDGSIQEAGAIVWSNGEAHHYGWGASPDDRDFNFAREVDYCSAASLLIRRGIFEQ